MPIIQSFAQLEQNYGKEGADVIIDNTQLTIFGGFAPNSTSAEVLSKSLGSRTVMSGSVSKSKNDPSQSLQMIERPLMTPDELKSLPKGTFVVMKTGFYPMKVKLKLFFKWGIEFEEQYQIAENGNREVHYANRSELFNNIIQTYCLTILNRLLLIRILMKQAVKKRRKMKILKPRQMQNRLSVKILLMRMNQHQHSKMSQQKNPKIQVLNRTQTSKEK